MYSKVRSSDRYVSQVAMNEMIDLASELLSANGRTLMEGACSLHYLSSKAGLCDDSPFSDGFLREIDEDCDNLPLFDDFRAKCSPGYLAECEPRIDTIAAEIKNKVQEKCRMILALYHTKDLDGLEQELLAE